MFRRLKSFIALIGLLGALSYGVQGSGFCTDNQQTLEACEDHDGYCSIFAWNYKIWYTKYYKCCYSDNGDFQYVEETGRSGPTPPVEGECCQSLVGVYWDDWHWTLPCLLHVNPE